MPSTVTRPLYIAVHIPKTGGTSLNHELRRQFDGRHLDDNDDKPLSRQWSRIGRRVFRRYRVRLRRRRLLRDHRLIVGHFRADKYLALGRDNLFYLGFLRDPVERTLSHYYYWKYVTAVHNPVEIERQPLLKALVEDRLSLEEFAGHPVMRGIYRRFFGRLSPLDFDFIGITEDYDRSIRLLNAMLGTDIAHRRDKVTERGPPCEVDDATLRAVRAANADNYRYYDLAQQRFADLWVRHGPVSEQEAPD